MTILSETDKLLREGAPIGFRTMTIQERIKAALDRIRQGQASMRVPAYQTDPDIVLSDCLTILEIAIARPEALSATPDPGTEKILLTLLDRAYKMMLMSGYKVAVVDSDNNDPIVAWMSDARHVLYGSGRQPDPVRDLHGAPPPRQRFEFDRIRRGQVMAEGIVVHAATLEEATAKAEKMAAGDAEVRLRLTPSPPLRTTGEPWPWTDAELADIIGFTVPRLENRCDANKNFAIGEYFGRELIALLRECERRFAQSSPLVSEPK